LYYNNYFLVDFKYSRIIMFGILLKTIFYILIVKMLDQIQWKIKNFIKKNPNWVVFIVWPTASGKTKLSIDLINSWIDAEIISADSRQIFKYMDIWTDKISLEIRNKIKHHLIDFLNPDEFYTAWDWKKDSLKIIASIQKKWKIPFIVWWTGLYTDTIYKNYSLPDAKPDFVFREKLYKQEEQNPGILHKQLQKIDPQEAMKLHPNSIRFIIRALEIYEKTWKPKTEVCYEQEVPFPILMIIKWADKEIANPKINKRIKEMFQIWLIDEVQKLLNMWYNIKNQALQSIWYKEIIGYLEWKYNLEKAEELLKRNTHHYAKRQRSFFRRYLWDMKANPKKNVEYLFIE